MMKPKIISNWGHFPSVEGIEEKVASFDEISNIFSDKKKAFIPRGMGRSYGDASLGERMISTRSLDYILLFDRELGIIECEAGVTLDQLLQLVVPEGWFLPVTPGTKFISVGGAIASDVHGKNHHSEGSFCDHVLEVCVMLPSGEIVNCSPSVHTELFNAVRGGMGLTGFILKARFQLKKIQTSYIKQIQIKAGNFRELLDLFNEYKGYTYTMAWIDCLKKGQDFGRGIVMAGEHALADELTATQAKQKLEVFAKPLFTFPFYMPSSTLNAYTISLFNFFYYHKNTKTKIENIVPYDPFFYPLDKIIDWNKGYGKKGFLQYQFVLPGESTEMGMTDILNRINKKGWGSFLAVFKIFGKQNGLISFPMEGGTLALDFPVRDGLFKFLDELDEIVVGYGGRLYMTKDARMKPKILWDSYEHIQLFHNLVKKINPDNKIRSMLSDRLEITG